MTGDKPIYEIVEDNWASGRTSYYIERDGVVLTALHLGGVQNEFKTLDEAIAKLQEMKFKPTKKVVYADSF